MFARHSANFKFQFLAFNLITHGVNFALKDRKADLIADITWIQLVEGTGPFDMWH